MKKFFGTLLVIIIIGVLVVGVYNYYFDGGIELPFGNTDKSGIKYCKSTDGTGYAVCGFDDNLGENVIIPSTYKDKPVVEILGEENGRGAFYRCETLKSIVIPNTVKRIGESAFYGCSSLEEINLPFTGRSVDGTENTHFGYIFGAGTYSENNEYVPSCLKTVRITSGTSVNKSSFCGCTSLTTVVIEEGVSVIDAGAFEDCSSLTTVVIPKSTTSIADWAFLRCSSLENIYYCGTEYDWSQISIGYVWSYGAGMFTITYNYIG